ncbi:AsmA-like C-terminal region-containing protein [Flavobacterium gawalongense]|uniref:AsmA family protein n=1 Tax=Flavobacterium gawalongense TaxID=2594432 RepID=A0A553BX51_9FLAO|nr:AsmA-like C-terminal region-containing protein [Flavobacterium gawalongense]TRX04276.1 AsmA family protein [Flavobacterium gawalongense]TRX09275.1 AsmA family protein [Flavobacterium gawalongense]TRX12912.1 AsmA family protein [Flavobacterium gawalongense]TRX13256.1 AsmA family protein [Flavobacterium gawalongense]TRX30682.1 AsmA family protein [Flavobacterium gawalongense]
MMKKILKIIGILIILLAASLFAVPYFFKDQIKAKISKAINEKVDAKVSFADADLNLFKNFPNANVTLDQLVIINKAPFEGDTLVLLGELNLKMSIKELFKGKEEVINIDGITSKNGLINIIFNKDGIGNYDIALKDDKTKDDGKSSPLSLKIQDYKIENFKFRYFDEKSKIKMVIDSLNHEGTGDFAAQKLDLVTKSTAKISLDMDKVNYMKDIALTLDAVLGIDLEKSKYTFKQNKALINQLPLEFDGFIQMVEAGQEYDLKFKTPTSSFKNFLGVIPAAYAASLNDVKTTGDFTVVGFAKGLYSDTTVPKFKIEIVSNNASFQYLNLPKSVQNIVIDTKIINETGILNDTYVNLDKLSFKIDQDVFNAKANIKNITQNAIVDAALKGTINLANLSKAYPIKLDKPLSGILKADVTTKFDMQSVEKNQYENIKNAGTMSLSGFNYVDENGKTMNISNALVQFNPSQVNLKELNATTGKSDISVTGVLENFYGFIFRNQELKGNFNMNSNQLAVDDFMTTGEATKTQTKKAEAMKIPAFLNCTLTAKANTVLYDNLTLKDVSGKLIVKDEKVTLQNVKTYIFGGTIGVNGAVSTKGKTPIFNMDLNLNQVDIAQSFTQLDMLKKIAPIAGIINGKLNSTIKLNGNLDATELTPDLKTLTGDLLGQLLSTTINSSNSTLLTALGSNLKFIDVSKINLNDLKAAVTFKDGKVNVKPFNIKYQDIKATIGGSHGFDQSMNYNIKFDVPAKYLGSEANALIAKLSPADAAKLENLPINALLTGNFTNPKITTDIKSAVNNLTTQLVKQQKERLVKQGTSALTDYINKNKKPSDTTKTATPTTKEETTTAVKTKAADLLNGLFNKKKKVEEPKTTP